MGGNVGEADIKSVRTVGRQEDGGEPDAVFSRGSGVAYRYTLCLREPEEAGTILRILADVAIPLLYLLLLPRGPRSGYRASFSGSTTFTFRWRGWPTWRSW